MTRLHPYQCPKCGAVHSVIGREPTARVTCTGRTNHLGVHQPHRPAVCQPIDNEDDQ